MPEDYQRIELITGAPRRRYWSTNEKLRIIEESLELGETVSSVARRNDVAPNLLYRWRGLMSEGGVAALGSDGARQGTGKKTDLAAAVAAEGRFPVKRVAEALGVSRSNLIERSQGRSKPRGPYEKTGDAELLPLIRRLVDERPTYGYRRIIALLNRELARTERPLANRKRVHRIMQRHALVLEKHTGRREGRVHDGKVAVMRSNLR